MEINKPNPILLNSYIRIYDDVLSSEVLENLFKVCKNNTYFEDGKIVALDKQKVDKSIRNTKIWNLTNINEKSLTVVHWCNYLTSVFKTYYKKYFQDVNNTGIFKLENVSILKYTAGGHYRFHVDHSLQTPRTLSGIFLINDDYEGGSLMFATPIGENTLEIQKIKNRLIIWPSNFLYPHSVQPVISGERYSVVSWAL